jgi:hypothetical protein
MPIEVEYSRDVFRFLEKHCTPEERAEFYVRVDAVKAEPIKNSDPCIEPELSRYMLRFFRFGLNKAIFKLDAFRNRIRVVECRRISLSSRHPRPRMPGDPSPN